jgi:hypothetical protein
VADAAPVTSDFDHAGQARQWRDADLAQIMAQLAAPNPHRPDGELDLPAALSDDGAM